MLKTVDYVPKGTIKRAVIFLHGYGSNGSDFSSLIYDLSANIKETAFYCPDAPEPVVFTADGGDEGIYQWYEINNYNPVELKRNIDQMKYVFSEYTALAENSRIKLTILIKHIIKKHGITADKISLIGFSQGGLVAVLTALMYPETLGPIVSFSGMSAVINRNLRLKVSPKIILIHGDNDPVVPIEATDISTKLLANFNIIPEVHIISDMAHEITKEATQTAITFLQNNFSNN